MPLDSHAVSPVREGSQDYVLRVKRLKGEKVLWDVEYLMKAGMDHRLFFVNQDPNRAKHLNLLGGSYTFGVNLEDDDTLAGFFRRKFGEEFFINNFGIPGAGPSEMLEFLDRYDHLIKRTGPGVSYYFFIDDHIPRALMDLQHVADWNKEPYYIPNRKGDVSYAGPFYSAKPFLNGLLNVADSFQLLRKLGFNPPFGKIKNINQAHKNHVCSLMAGIKRRVLRSFPSTEFKVVFLPKEGLSHFLLADCLKRKNISIVDLSSLINLRSLEDPSKWSEFYFSDFHPRGKYNEVVVEALAELPPFK